jgi:putative aminopeptidase FrvX
MKMTEDKLNRLKEVLSVPTHSRNEKLMIEYLTKVLTEKGYEHYVDKHGNIYVTKGVAEYYPCFIAHTDTVHAVNLNLTVIQEEKDGKVTLRGIDGISKKESGIGGDDKCGVYLCLEMLDTLPNVKVALFVSEEIGCQGSQYADPEFFKNVGYAIQYDSPEGDSMSLTLMGRYLFNQKSEFANKVGGLITEAGITDWAQHPYTDVWQIMEKFNIACLNLAAGYYRYHTAAEYVIVDEVQNGFELGLKLLEQLGENRYDNSVEKRVYSYGNYYGSSGYKKPEKLLNEGKKKDEDDWTGIFNGGEYVYRGNYGPYDRGYDYDDWY